jgi:hypothetical protein
MTSALLALFLSRLYSSFFSPIVRLRMSSSRPVGNRLSELSKTISTEVAESVERGETY